MTHLFTGGRLHLDAVRSYFSSGVAIFTVLLAMVLPGIGLSGYAFAQQQQPAQAPAAPNPLSQGMFSQGSIQDIQVIGNRRIETSSVVAITGLAPGNRFDPARLNEATRSLFDSGLFRDAAIDRRGNTLVIRVAEFPVVNQVAFEGNRNIRDDALSQEVRLKERDVLTSAKVKSDLQRILSLYRAAGRYDAIVEPKIIALAQNRANLVYEISEGPKTRIRSIGFLGNKAFTDRRLRRQVLSRQAAFWRFLSSFDSYDPDRVAADREVLTRFYQENGYADFEVESSIGELRSNDRSFALTFAVNEGQLYRIGNIKVNSEIPRVPSAQLASLATYRSGEIYDISEVERTSAKISDEVGSLGFAFAEVEVDYDRRPGGIIDVIYKIEEGPKVFVERINITGNTRTQDRVVRREMRLVEGDAFSVTKVRRSRNRIQGLGFFSRIDVSNRAGSAPDKTIIDIDVEEQSTGSLQLGGSFSSDGGLGATLSVSEQNLLGRGTRAAFDVNLSQDSQTVNLSVTEPYFLGRNLSFGVDSFYSNVDRSESGYEEQTFGGGLRLGYALDEFTNQSWGIAVRQSDITPTSSSISSPFLIDERGKTLRVILSHNLNWRRLDNPNSPKSGVSLSMSNEYAGLGGDVEFFKTRLTGQAFYPITDSLRIAAKAEAGILVDLDDEGTRISDRFFMGTRQVRGFSSSGIGPRVRAGAQNAGSSLGGNNFYNGKLEVRYDVPLPIETQLEARVFGDVGALWDMNRCDSTITMSTSTAFACSDIDDSSSPRASVGLGFQWISPLGPLQIDYAWPIAEESFDEVQNFSFNVGTTF